MATVYKAHQPALERYVAIKVIHEYLAAEDDQFLRRFHREAKAVASLRHPNIVQVFDFGVEGGTSYMVMEYLEGTTLETRLEELAQRSETMAWEDVWRIFLHIASAVAYAHSQGMVHRDLKPANVILTTRGDAILTDFGIARIVGGTQYTAAGAIIGTPAYMSPEQGQGERGDERSDIYALGGMLYEMLVGRPPFEAGTALAVMLKHVNEPVPPPCRLNPAIPRGVEQVVLRALAKHPDDRYQTAVEMVSALRNALTAQTGEVIRPARADEAAIASRAAPPGASHPRPAAASRAAPSRAVPKHPRRAARRAGLPSWAWTVGAVVLGGAIVVGLLVVIVVVVTMGIQGPEPASPAEDGTPGATIVPAEPTAILPTLERAVQLSSSGRIIVDNSGPGFVIEAGDWGTCDNGDCDGVCYDADFRYAGPECPACRARFDLEVPSAGEYDVWTWWPQGDDRATDTLFTVVHSQGSLAVTVDQQNNGSAWYKLGTVAVEAGESVSILVEGTVTGYANADAVALTPVQQGQ